MFLTSAILSHTLDVIESERDKAMPSHTSSSSTSPAHKRKTGRKKFRETRHPVYRGVRQRNGNRWVCEVREPRNKTRIWLGSFPTPEMAAKAHDVAALAFRGACAALNFPDSAARLPRAKSSSAADIQAAALEAAVGFHTSTELMSSSFSTAHCQNVPEVQLKESERLEKVPEGPTEAVFMDEEELFNMPSLIKEMAEGLLLAPPTMLAGFGSFDSTSYVDSSLWNDH